MKDNERQEREAVIAEARTWLRTPYHHASGVKGAGVDCGYLLIRVYHAVGLIPNIEPEPYPPDWALHRSEEKYLGWVEQYAHPVEQPQPGDLALYKVGRCISHGGIILAWPTIIHASQPEGGCVLSDGMQGWLSGRLHGFYSIW